MRFAFTEDQILFRDAVRDLLANECPAAVVREAWENETGRTQKAWAALAEMGVVSMAVSEPNRGLGMSELDWVLVLEETGRAALPEPVVETTVVGMALLEAIGQEVPEGAVSVAVGFESQPYVLYADTADLLVLQHGGDLHVLGRDGVSVAPQRSVDRSRRLFRVEWTPTTQTLAASGSSAREQIALAWDRAALATAAQLCGLAESMLATTVEYAAARQQFGKPIGSQQAIKHKLADVKIKLDFTRPLVHLAAYSLARQDPEASVHVSMAKSMASDLGLLAAGHALQCHGAIGYTYEYDLQLWMKRAWALARAWGDAAWHRDRVARAVVD